METIEQYRNRMGIGNTTPEEVEAIEKRAITQLIADEPQILDKLNELEGCYKVLIKLLSGIYKSLEQVNERLKWAEEQVDGVESYLSNTLKEIKTKKNTMPKGGISIES